MERRSWPIRPSQRRENSPFPLRPPKPSARRAGRPFAAAATGVRPKPAMPRRPIAERRSGRSGKAATGRQSAAKVSVGAARREATANPNARVDPGKGIAREASAGPIPAATARRAVSGPRAQQVPRGVSAKGAALDRMRIAARNDGAIAVREQVRIAAREQATIVDRDQETTAARIGATTVARGRGANGAAAATKTGSREEIATREVNVSSVAIGHPVRDAKAIRTRRVIRATPATAHPVASGSRAANGLRGAIALLAMETGPATDATTIDGRRGIAARPAPTNGRAGRGGTSKAKAASAATVEARDPIRIGIPGAVSAGGSSRIATANPVDSSGSAASPDVANRDQANSKGALSATTSGQPGAPGANRTLARRAQVGGRHRIAIGPRGGANKAKTIRASAAHAQSATTAKRRDSRRRGGRPKSVRRVPSPGGSNPSARSHRMAPRHSRFRQRRPRWQSGKSMRPRFPNRRWQRSPARKVFHRAKAFACPN